MIRVLKIDQSCFLSNSKKLFELKIHISGFSFNPLSLEAVTFLNQTQLLFFYPNQFTSYLQRERSREKEVNSRVIEVWPALIHAKLQCDE